MLTTGRFEVERTPQEDGDAPAGRMLLRKTYEGHMSGSAVGQMISKRSENGTAVYHAIGSMAITQDETGHRYRLEYEV